MPHFQFRLEDATTAKIDAIIAEQTAQGRPGMSRSSVARALVRAALDQPEKVAFAHELVQNVWVVQQEVIHGLLDKLEEKLGISLESPAPVAGEPEG